MPEAKEPASAVVNREYWSIPDFCRVHYLHRATTYSLLRDNKLEAVKVGRKTLIVGASVERWRATLPRFQSSAAA